MSNISTVLREASKLDIQLVGIGMPHPLLNGSESFPWPDSSLFANGHLPDLFADPCAAWEIAKRADVWGGVGNNEQAQLSREAQKALPKGVWQLQADGWVKIA